MHPHVDVIVAGHLCLDIIPGMSRVPADPRVFWKPGALLQVDPAVLGTGGAVSNTGIALHRLGVKTRLLGKVGTDSFGRIVRELLRGIDKSLAESIIVSDGEDTSYSLVLSPGGSDRLFLHHSGANDTYTADDVPDNLLGGARLLHFGYPTNMRQFYSDGGTQLETLFCKARAHGLTTSLDTTQVDQHSDAGRVDWRALLRRVLPLVDLFLPSFDEIAFMLGHGSPPITAALLDKIADELLEMGSSIVALKLGDQGLYLRTTGDAKKLARAGAAAPNHRWIDRQLLAPCFEVDVAGTTGSGDCTIAGFLTALLNGQTPEQSATIATGVGAFCVERPDATSGVPTWPQLQHRLDQPWPRKPVTLPMTGWRWHDGSSLWLGPNDLTGKE